jgi:hypothetical protein
MDFEHTIDSNDNGGDDDEFGKKIEEPFEGTPGNLKENLGAILSNAPKSLESCHVGLKFKFKMLEFMDSMN